MPWTSQKHDFYDSIRKPHHGPKALSSSDTQPTAQPIPQSPTSPGRPAFTSLSASAVAIGAKMSGKGKDKKKPDKGQDADPDEQPLSAAAYSANIKSDTPFPVPELYFKVFESEIDEPEAKIRRDVNKLYDRWMEQYGRRWPENGMNTDDLVWLAEEAYKPRLVDERGRPYPQPSIGSIRAMLKPVEKEAYPGEFLEEPPDDTPGAQPAAGTGKKKKKKGPAKNLSNYEATLAGGTWVTDEFESADYEAGNLETLWGMPLWDYESKPLMMPDGPPDEAQGEESEEWDDFYGSYRPRFIDTDDAREAVWATDEFESDEDNTESEWEPEYVGAGLGLEPEDPFNPQYSLRHSNHPLAPFPGEPLKWSSFVFDDGTTYEGLTRDAVPHGMGVMIFGNGTGGGFHFRDVRRGDKYEGEFQVGYAHGLGQFTSENRGEVYIGEFFAGQRHGCGIRVNMQPYFYLLERGDDPVSAYMKTHERIMRNIEFRTWYRNRALGSDNEDEILYNAIADDFDDPAAVVKRNIAHEYKLREWNQMDIGDKAMRKAVEIIDNVQAHRQRRRGGAGPRQHFEVGEDGRLHEILDTDGNDTDFDSVELMVGADTDGAAGLGWTGDTEDTDLMPFDSRLQEAIMADVAEDKLEESEDKEAILGEDLVNPFTGLTLRDYLDGREGVYKEMLVRTGTWDKLLGRAPPPKGSKGHRRLASAADGEGGSYVSLEEERDAMLQKQLDAAMSRTEQAKAAYYISRARRGWEDEPASQRSRNPFSEDTDTRFETESDEMELCELAEILGTVDEAREIVTRARMWRWKPDGEVTYRFAQDANGAPLPLMQDPLHYPYNTKFMAPGPLGQCHPLPNDRSIREEMRTAAKNYAHIYSLYNFDYDPEPGSVQYKIDQRIKRAAELELSSLARMAEGAEAEFAYEDQQQAALELASLPTDTQATPSTSAQQQQGPAQQSVFASMTGAGGPVVGAAHAPFASMSLGLSRAGQVAMNALTKAAKRAATRRPHVLRPSHMRRRRAAGPSAAQQVQ